MKYITIIILLIVSFSCTDKTYQAFSSELYFPDFEEEYSLLESKLDTTTIDSNKVKVYLELSRLLKDTIPKRSIEYAQKGIDLSQKINWSKGEVQCYYELASCYSVYYDDYYKAIEICKKALKVNLESGDSVEYGLSYARIGIYYLEILKSTNDDVFDILLLNLHKAKEILSKFDMPHFAGLSDKFLHEAYIEIGDYKTALKYHESYRKNERNAKWKEHIEKIKKLEEEHSEDIKELEEKHIGDIAQTKIESYKQGGNIISYLSVTIFILLLVILYQLFKIKKLRKVHTVMKDITKDKCG